jgi:acyl-CoA thioesterase FadM
VSVDGPFVRSYRVRFDEAGADGCLRPSGFLRYAQDVAWQHSEAAGYDRTWYAEQRSHWLVRAVGMRLLRPVAFGTTLDVSTEVIGWRRVLARRHTRFIAPDGEPCAEADTDWALVGPAGRPMSVPKAIVDTFATGALFTPLRVLLDDPPAIVVTSTVTVRDADLDPMGHLNNAAYVDLIDAAVGHDGGLRGARAYRVEYLRPAPAGSEVSVITWPLEAGLVACRMDAAGVQLCRATRYDGASA